VSHLQKKNIHKWHKTKTKYDVTFMIIEIIDKVLGWQTFIYRGYRHVNTCSLCRYVTTILEHWFCLNRSTTNIFTKQRIKTFSPNIFSLKETYCIQIYPVSEGYLRKILFERTNTTLYGILKDKYPSDGGKVEKKLRIGQKYPFYQLIRRQHSYIRLNYFCFCLLMATIN
jgi:hypothetical protein